MKKMRIKLSRKVSAKKFRKGAKVNKRNVPRNSRGGTML